MHSKRSAAIAALAAAALSAGTAGGATYEWALPEWRATWSAPRLADNRGFAVRATSDAVYVAGVTGSYAEGAGDLFLLRYDHSGILVWQRTWGGFELDQAQAIQVDDGGVWVVGSGTDEEARIFAVLLRFSHAGDLQFEKTWARGEPTALQAVAARGDAVFVAGLTHPTRADRNLYAARIDLPAGSIAWEIELGGEGWDEAWDIAADGSGLFLAGYSTAAGSDTSQAEVLAIDPLTGVVLRQALWGGEANDEARAMVLTPEAILVTGGAQTGRSTDVFVASLDRQKLELEWLTTTEGRVSGGGGYGIAVGTRGIYVSGGTYDFPAGGDAALLRFSHSGELEWTQLMGYPGFWDWAFDVDARGDQFYVAGVLWRPGAEWYQVMTVAYDEDYPVATLEGVATRIASGDIAGARGAMSHFWVGDFLRWAEEGGVASYEPGEISPSVPPSLADPGPVDLPGVPAPSLDPDQIAPPDPSGRSYVYWEGASDYGRAHGVVWADTARDPAAGEDGADTAFSGLADDAESGNYALVRNYTGVRVSLFGGFIRLRYYVSHDRLIPQGGYLYVGPVGIAIPPPPV